MSLLAQAHRVLLERPDDLALALHTPSGTPRLSHRDLHERAAGVASALAVHGIAPGQRVLLLFSAAQWDAFLPTWLGVLWHGAVAVPVSPRFTAAEVARVAEDCRPVAALGDLARLAGSGHPAVVVGLDALADLRARASVPPGRPATDLATVLYTSGTTGVTKGVACPVGSLTSATFPAPTRSLHAFPLDSAAGQNITVRTLLGSPTHTVPGFAPKQFAALVAAEQVEWAGLAPAMAGMLLRSGQLARYDTGSLRTVALAGAPSSPRLLQQVQDALPGVRVVNHYTLTEAGSMFLAQPYDPARPTAIGRADGSTRVRVVAEDGGVAAPGTPGELLLRPAFDNVARYYLTDPDATRAVFRPDGWLATGDVGYLDADGYVHLVDRKKDIIVRGGGNISSLEVEAVLAGHEAVLEVAVFAVPDPTFGEVVGAAVVGGGALDPADLRAYARGQGLGEEKVPEVVLILDELPRTATGKVRKRDLAALAAGATPPAPPAHAERGVPR